MAPSSLHSIPSSRGKHYNHSHYTSGSGSAAKPPSTLSMMSPATLSGITPYPSSSTEPRSEHGHSEDKYKRLKRKLKEMMERNEKITDDLERAKKKIHFLRKEKDFLLDKIDKMSKKNDSEVNSSEEFSSDFSMSESESDGRSAAESVISHSPPPHKRHHSAHYLPTALTHPPLALVHKRKSPPTHQITPTNTVLAPPTSASSAPTPSTRGHPKPKRSKKPPIARNIRRVQPVERDEHGNYKLPAQVGILLVHQLGYIVPDRESFHNERYIWPVGFTVSRTYPSMVDPNRNATYTCSISDGGDGPRFEIIPDDAPDQTIIANTATGAWTAVVRRANEVRRREHSNSASGPDYFGFTHPTIAKMIQDLDGARQCKNYVWQEFEIMQSRTAAGVAAAAQKKLSNLEKMGSANKKPPPEDGSVVPSKSRSSANISRNVSQNANGKHPRTAAPKPTSSTSTAGLKEEEEEELEDEDYEGSSGNGRHGQDLEYHGQVSVEGSIEDLDDEELDEMAEDEDVEVEEEEVDEMEDSDRENDGRLRTTNDVETTGNGPATAQPGSGSREPVEDSEGYEMDDADD